jgi:hypothetical protein
MKRIDFRLVLGAFLIVSGIMSLLQNLNILPEGVDWFWGLLFTAGGVGFLYSWFTSRSLNWWAIIPGLVLLAIGILLFLPNSLEILGGSIFLGAIGLAFWIAYFTGRERWWAIIPGGVLVTLAAIAGIPEQMQGIASGGIFFLGLAVTFLLVALLPNPVGKMDWAYIPALVLFVMGASLTAFSDIPAFAEYILPAALVIVGGYLIYRAFVKNN